jgi:hypothetical protein
MTLKQFASSANHRDVIFSPAEEGQGLFPTILLHFLHPWRSIRIRAARWRNEQTGEPQVVFPGAKVPGEGFFWFVSFRKKMNSPDKVKALFK